MTPGERAKAFVDEILIPREVDAELGRLTSDDHALIAREALARGISGGLHAREHGGQGWTHVEWFEVEEQFGRSTNALSWLIPTAYNVLAHGSPEQIERYLKPALRGELHDAYAVTEEFAGSDPSGITTTATKTSDGWRIDGEKWFVTYGDVAAVYIVMALAPEPTLFLIDAGTPGISVVDDPPFTHNYPHGHPTLRFDGRRGRRGRRDRRRRRGRRAAARVVRRGAARDRRPRLRRDAAAAGGDDRVGDRARAGRRADHRPPGRRLSPGRLRRRRRRGPPARARGRPAGRRRRRPEAHPRQGLDGQAVRRPRPRTAAPTAACRSSAAAATRAPTSPSASGASCAWTASGRARARSSA